jgi:hypothetical protein
MMFKPERVSAHRVRRPGQAQPAWRAADSEPMSRWRAFVEVLDEILTNQAPADARPSGRVAGDRITGTPLYAFGAEFPANRFWTAAGAIGSGRLAETATSSLPPRSADRQHTRPDHGRSVPVPAAVRDLTPAEETALHTLIKLGARIDRHFTSRQLRSAFRTLAQRYHPDRHPHAGPAERMQLGAAFAELTQAYGVLHDAAH